MGDSEDADLVPMQSGEDWVAQLDDFPIKNKCADTVADVLVKKIILRFGMPLVIHSDQGREFENGLMKSLCKRFNRTCLMMLSMFVNDRRDNWNELLHAYRTSGHESTGYSPFPPYDGRRMFSATGCLNRRITD